MKKGKNANYNFEMQKDPSLPMGQGDFANMPRDAKYMTFSKDHSYRDGIINSFTNTLVDTSDIYENQR